MSWWDSITKAIRPTKRSRRTVESVRSDATALLAQVEGELRRADTAARSIGTHASDCETKLVAEIAERRKRLKPHGPNDPQQEREYLYLLGQLRRARQVAGLAAQDAD